MTVKHLTILVFLASLIASCDPKSEIVVKGGASGSNGTSGSKLQGSPFVLTLGKSVNLALLTGLDEVPVSCDTSPSLPSGLRMDVGCTLTGTPTALSAAADYKLIEFVKSGALISRPFNLAVSLTATPTVTFTTPTTQTITSANAGAYPLAGTCSDSGQGVVISGAANAIVRCIVGVWSTSLDLSKLADASSVVFSANHSNALKQDAKTATLTVAKISNLTLDTTPPTITITAQPDPLVRPGDPQTIGFTVSDNLSGVASLTWSITLDGSTYSSPVSLSTTATTLTTTISSSAASSTTSQIKLTATDLAGNSVSVQSSVFQIATQIADLFAGQPHVVRGYADGAADSARFSQPGILTTDGTTYIYAVDLVSIRRISIATGYSDTIAGVGSISGYVDGVGSAARFTGLRAITYLNNMLYATESTNTIRAINVDPNSPAFKTVTTLAGTALSSALTDGVGPAARFTTTLGITNDGTYLYITDSHCIRKIDPSTGAVTTIAGSTSAGGTTDAAGISARFNTPQRILHDNGNLYITDGVNTIRKLVISTLNVTTLANTAKITGHVDGSAANARFEQGDGIASDGTYLYIAEPISSTIRKVAIADGTTTTLTGQPYHAGYADGAAGAALFNYPRGLVVVGGILYETDVNNPVIRKIDLATAITSRFAGAPIGSPFDVYKSGFGAPIGQIAYLSDLATVDGNAIYAAQLYGSTIRKIDIGAGTITTIAGSVGVPTSTDGFGTAATFNAPYGIAQYQGGGQNVLYVSEITGNKIRMIDLNNSNAVTTIAGSGTAGSTDNATGTSATFNIPRGLCTDGTYIYVADSGGARIRRITVGAPWAVTTIAGTTTAGFVDASGTSAKFNTPFNCAVSGSFVYISDSNNNVIRKIDTSNSNSVTTFAGLTTGVAGSADGIGTAASFKTPRQLMVLGSALYVADYGNGRMRKIDLASGTVTTVAGGGSISTPADVGALPGIFSTMRGLTGFGTKLFFSSDATTPLRSLDTTTSTVNIIGPASSNNRGSANIFGALDGNLSQLYSNRFVTVVVGPNYAYFADRDNYVIKRSNLDGTGLTTIAGTEGTGGYLDGPGATAKFGSIGSIMMDSNYIYVLDNGNSLINF